jgi:zinc protease
LGDWARPAEPSSEAAREPARPGATLKTLITMPGSGQSGVVVAGPFAALGDADRRIAEVASALLAGGYSARLNQEVRIRRGLSYGAFGGGESHPAGGMFTANAQTQHATAREVAQLMRDEILRVAREEAGEAELAARKATLVGSFTRQLETTSGLAGQVASQYFQGRPVTELARYVDEVLAVTPAQVRRFASSVWQPENLRTVIAGELPALADETAVPIAALDLEHPDLR